MITLAGILILFTATKAESKRSKMKTDSNVELGALVPKLDVLPPPKTMEARIEQNVTVRIPTNIFGFAQRRNAKMQIEIVYVAPNSAAYRNGLQAGDKILAEDFTDNRATVIIERNKKQYGCSLTVNKPEEAKTNKKDSALVGRIALANSQLILLVDCSASMRTKDCPGGISRWQWCQRNTKTLYERCFRDAANDARIITFDSRYQTHQDGLYGKLDKIFSNDLPDGETFMAPPLIEAFRLVKDSLSKDRPAIVAVLTDGRPSDFKEVKTAIIEQANTLKKPELFAVSFIEVGSSERYLYELDNELLGQGARTDIVSVTGFHTVNWKGLDGTLSEIALQAQKARLDKAEEKKRASNLSATVQTASQAKEAADKAAAERAAANKAAASAQTDNRVPPVEVHPPIKAHPSGTPAEGQAPPKSVVEVNEKETIRRESANRTYKFNK